MLVAVQRFGGKLFVISERRLVFSSTEMFNFFSLSWLRIIIFKLFSPVLYELQILMHNTDITHSSYISYVWFIFHWLAMSHCCYNPIIYCYMNARFRFGFFQILFFVPGIRHCCCINAYPRDRTISLRTGIALKGKFFIIALQIRMTVASEHCYNWANNFLPIIQ